MRSLIVGTAGHIDHGKSALVRSLTGTDPDRLKEEKARGITIDLGFAHLALDGETTASFIDVPGHERFVRNMLAGAHGIDAVMLVVAADESVMPQTREHFHICRLLGIPTGLVALTKCDLADADTLAIAEMEVRELLKGSFLEGAPLVRVSARTLSGLDDLKANLLKLAAQSPMRSAEGILRLPIDRVFSLRGFGTVITGTLVSGALRVGSEVEVLPRGLKGRVRGLQIHGEAVDVVAAGHRAAVNLAGLEVSELTRGDVIASPGTLKATSMLDVEITLLPNERPLADQTRLRIHVASAEILGRIRLLGLERIEPGRSGLAQLRLERPTVASRGQRIILRSYSPPGTVGGALVLDPLPPKRRRLRGGNWDGLSALGQAPPGAAARIFLEEAGTPGLDAESLQARVSVPLDRLLMELDHAHVTKLGTPPAWFLSETAVSSLRQAVRNLLSRFHEDNPLRSGIPREELRRRLFGRTPPRAFEHVLESLDSLGQIRLGSDSVALVGHSLRLSPQEEEAGQAILSAAQTAGLAGVELSSLVPRIRADAHLLQRVSGVLLADGRLCRVGDNLLHRDHLESLKQEVRRRWPPGSRMDVTAFKQLTGLTRKFVIPLLEYLDKERVTRRSGNDRLVLM